MMHITGVYREIKSIECEDGNRPFVTTSTSISYIVSGFKLLDTSLVEVNIAMHILCLTVGRR